jgi:Protein of unknown function (DUF2892)
MHRQLNVGTSERILRVTGGGLAALFGLLLFLSSPGTLFIWLAAVTLVAVGADFVVTGITGYCPLYLRLGRTTVHHSRA